MHMYAAWCPPLKQPFQASQSGIFIMMMYMTHERARAPLKQPVDENSTYLKMEHMHELQPTSDLL